MNKSLDLYLKDIKGSVEEIVKKMDGISIYSFSRIIDDIEEAVLAHAFILQCPFCGEDPLLETYDNSVGVKCSGCGGSGELTNTSSEIVIADMEEHHLILDSRFGPGEEWDIEKSLSHSGLKTYSVSMYVIAAWLSVEKWNRRV
jgi:hypothetical protein